MSFRQLSQVCTIVALLAGLNACTVSSPAVNQHVVAVGKWKALADYASYSFHAHEVTLELVTQRDSDGQLLTPLYRLARKDNLEGIDLLSPTFLSSFVCSPGCASYAQLENFDGEQATLVSKLFHDNEYELYPLYASLYKRGQFLLGLTSIDSAFSSAFLKYQVANFPAQNSIDKVIQVLNQRLSVASVNDFIAAPFIDRESEVLYSTSVNDISLALSRWRTSPVGNEIFSAIDTNNDPLLEVFKAAISKSTVHEEYRVTESVHVFSEPKTWLFKTGESGSFGSEEKGFRARPLAFNLVAENKSWSRQPESKLEISETENQTFLAISVEVSPTDPILPEQQLSRMALLDNTFIEGDTVCTVARNRIGEIIKINEQTAEVLFLAEAVLVEDGVEMPLEHGSLLRADSSTNVTIKPINIQASLTFKDIFPCNIN